MQETRVDININAQLIMETNVNQEQIMHLIIHMQKKKGMKLKVWWEWKFSRPWSKHWESFKYSTAN